MGCIGADACPVPVSQDRGCKLLVQARVNGSSNYNCSSRAVMEVEILSLDQYATGLKCKIWPYAGTSVSMSISKSLLIIELSILNYYFMFVYSSGMSSENVSSADNQQERVPKNIEYLKWYLSGFTDGEGCFSVSISKHKYARWGWKIDPFFQVYQHKDNSRILYLFKEVFGCGYVSKKGGNPVCEVYCVDKIQDLLEKVLTFFAQYPLMGEKYKNFLLFKQICEGLFAKKHFELSGFKNLVRLAFRMNKNGKYRKNSIEAIFGSLTQSSETKRQIHAEDIEKYA